MDLLLRWVAAAIAVFAAVYLVEGIHLEGGVGSFFGVALILGLVNAMVRPVLRALACGLIFLTLCLFLQIINDGMDILGGNAISRGPRNALAHGYIGTPVGITVEGANDAPRVTNVGLAATEDGAAVSGSFSGRDRDSDDNADTLTYNVTQPDEALDD